MRYTDFEDQLLVACFLLAEEQKDDVVGIREVLQRYGLDAPNLYIERAVRGFFVSGYTGHSPWVGDPFDRKIEISARGVREAERLVSLGVSVNSQDVVMIIDDSSLPVEGLQNTLANISAELTKNSVAAELGDKRQVIEADVEAGQRIIGSGRFSVTSLQRFLAPVLKFLADKFLGSALGELAKSALTLIARMI